jgi:hypothetical protein
LYRIDKKEKDNEKNYVILRIAQTKFLVGGFSSFSPSWGRIGDINYSYRSIGFPHPTPSL